MSGEAAGLRIQRRNAASRYDAAGSDASWVLDIFGTELLQLGFDAVHNLREVSCAHAEPASRDFESIVKSTFPFVKFNQVSGCMSARCQALGSRVRVKHPRFRFEEVQVEETEGF
jgi:hypothetical protein